MCVFMGVGGLSEGGEKGKFCWCEIKVLLLYVFLLLLFIFFRF